MSDDDPGLNEMFSELVQSFEEQTQSAKASLECLQRKSECPTLHESVMPQLDRGFSACVRVRPSDSFSGAYGPVAVSSGSNHIFVHTHRRNMRSRALELVTKEHIAHAVLGPECSDDDVHKSLGASLFQKVCRGGMAAVVMFGQTGTGKTHTTLSLTMRMPSALFLLGATEVHLTAVEIRGPVCIDLLSDTGRYMPKSVTTLCESATTYPHPPSQYDCGPDAYSALANPPPLRQHGRRGGGPYGRGACRPPVIPHRMPLTLALDHPQSIQS